MKKLKEVIESLHPLERSVLKHLTNNLTATELASLANLKEVEVMRALQWLEQKGVLELNQTKTETIEIGENGKNYLENGFPEKRFLKSITAKPQPMNKIKDLACLDNNEFSISLGLLKRNNCIKLGKEAEITKDGLNLLKDKTQEDFLKQLPKSLDNLTKEQIGIEIELSKRKDIIKTETRKIFTLKLLKFGKEILNSKINLDLIDTLTPEIIKTGTWKNKKFRRYTIDASVGETYAAKRYMVAQARNYIRQVWLDMGFKEMSGPMVESSFWNFDALFTPQDHPAREMQDTFFIEGSKKSPDKKLLSQIKKQHETKWNYKWEEKPSKELVLRTHTTSTTARTLANLKESDFPAKFFSVNRVFRNEALDWSHLFELNQVEGIVVDPNATFQDLIGYLKQYYSKLGYDKIRIRPAYFPYVEPGLEIDAFHPKKKKWVELGGAGILRPEVVIPLLGKDIPVLAWGQGLERGISEYYTITDIRELYKNDLKQLRNSKVWLK